MSFGGIKTDSFYLNLCETTVYQPYIHFNCIIRTNNGKKREPRALGYFFSILQRRVRYFSSDKFLDSATVYRSFSSVRSHLHVRQKYSRAKPRENVRKESANAGFAKRGKLQNTGNDVVSRIRLRWPFYEIRNCATYLRRRLSTPSSPSSRVAYQSAR